MPPSIARWGWPAAWAACVLVAGVVSLQLGEDVNWDLKNYHFYNPYAFLNARIAWDVAPAQVQSYHNPLGDLPFYGLVQAGTPPRVIAFLMASTTGIAAYFLLRLASLLFSALPRREQLLAMTVAVAVGLTGAAGMSVIGSTMNEWPGAALVVAALYYASRSLREGDSRGLMLAGILAGCAAGLKLTYVVFGAALVASAFFAIRDRMALRRAALTAAFMLLGFLATYGYWAAILAREFGNPFFPYFNGIFRSPWWEPVSFFDRNRGPRDPWEAIFFPLVFARRSLLVGETAFRDWRLAVMMVLGAAAGVKWLWLRIRAAQAPGASPGALAAPWRLLAAFTLVAYLLWLKTFSIYRYLVPLEMLCGPLIVACLLYVAGRWKLRWIAIAVVALLLLGTTRKYDWGRIPFGERYFEVAAPALPRDSLVVIGHSHPMAYAIAFFPADARFVAPSSNFIDDGQRNLLRRRMEEVVRTHRGPIFLLDHRNPWPKSETMLRTLGLARDESPCRIVRSNMDDDAMHVCRLRRLAGAGDRALPG